MRVACVCLLVGAAIAAPVCRSARADTITVHVYDFEYSTDPSLGALDPTINVGDTVHWVWDSGLHSVTSVAGALETFNSGDHRPAFEFDHTYTNIGTFWYYCDLHALDLGDGTAVGMVGTITVVPAPGAAVPIGVGVCAWGLRRRRR